MGNKTKWNKPLIIAITLIIAIIMGGLYTAVEGILDTNAAEKYCKYHGYDELEPLGNYMGRCVKLVPRFDGVGFDKEYSGYFDYDDIKEDLQ